MDNASKFFIGLSLAAFLGAGGVATYYGVQYNNLKNSHEIIAEDTTGVKQRLKELNDRIEALIQEKNTQQAQIQRLTQQNEAYLTIIEGLRDDLANSNLENEELEDQIEDLTSAVAENLATIQQLQTQNTNLLGEINALNGLLDQYSDLQAVTKRVDFYVDDYLFDSKVVLLGDTVTPNQMTLNQGYEFEGWTLDGENVVDLSNTLIATNTTFYAKFSKIYKRSNNSTICDITNVTYSGNPSDPTPTLNAYLKSSLSFSYENTGFEEEKFFIKVKEVRLQKENGAINKYLAKDGTNYSLVDNYTSEWTQLDERVEFGDSILFNLDNNRTCEVSLYSGSILFGVESELNDVTDLTNFKVKFELYGYCNTLDAVNLQTNE